MHRHQQGITMSRNTYLYRATLFAGIIALVMSGQSIACTASEWSASAGNVTANGAARFEDLCGLRINLAGATEAWVEDNSPGAEAVPVTDYVARFYAIRDDAVIPDGRVLEVFAAYGHSGNLLFGLELAGISGDNVLRISADNGSALEYSAASVTMPRGWRALELRWSSVSGTAAFGMDGVADLISISGLNNVRQAVAKVRLGAVSGNADAITGAIDADSFVSGRGESAGLVEKECNGASVVLDNITFLTGSRNCIASTSLGFANRTVFDPGSLVTVEAPVVTLHPGVLISAGAVLSVN